MASLLHALQLDMNPDSTEFCPWPGHHALLAVGTYQLDEASQRRLGQLHLYQMVHGSPMGGDDLPRGENDAVTEAEEGGDTAGAGSGTPCTPAIIDGAGWAHDSFTSRLGGLAAGAGSSGPHLLLAQQLDVPGIFDLKWSPPLPPGNQQRCLVEGQCRGGPWLGAALADGSMRAYRLLPSEEEEGGQSVALAEAFRCDAFPSGGGMALSLDWGGGCGCSEKPAACPAHDDRVALSSSSGSLSVLKVRDSGIEVQMEWQAHDLEAWCVAFSRTEVHLLYSGADDSCFKAWDMRDTGSPAFNNRKTHSAGVCTISPHPRAPHLLATGSYDESVRLWDVRVPDRPLLVAQVGTGGGNWRLRWHPSDPTLLLAACMYRGFAILKAGPPPGCPAVNSDSLKPVEPQQLDASELERALAETTWIPSSIEVVERYESHGSIAYGADWYQGDNHSRFELSRAATKGAGAIEGGAGSLVATCSFYDRLLHLWTPVTPVQ